MDYRHSELPPETRLLLYPPTLVIGFPSILLDKPVRPFVVDVFVCFSVFDHLNQEDFSIASF